MVRSAGVGRMEAADAVASVLRCRCPEVDEPLEDADCPGECAAWRG